MKRIFLKAKDKERGKYIWVKCVLLQENELTIDSITASFNQYLINSYPTKVFFQYPNPLFYKKNDTTYINNKETAPIKMITTRNIKSYRREIIFSSYSIMKNYLFKLFFGENGEEL